MFRRSKRLVVDQKQIKSALLAAEVHMEKILQKHGDGSFSSRAEMLGVIRLEVLELETAIQARDHDKANHELLDVAIACLFGLACSKGETLDY